MVRIKKPKVKKPKIKVPKPKPPKKPEVNVKLPDPGKIIREIEDGANKAKRQALSEVNAAGAKATREIKAAERQAVSTLESEVGPAIERFIQDLASEGMKPFLRQAARNCRWLAEAMDTVAEEAPQMVKAINKAGYDVNLKLNVEIDLEYKNFWSRSHEIAGILDRYANDGLALRRRDIRGFMIALGPDTIKFGGGASLSFGVDLGAVGKLKDLELDLFVLIADYVMKKMGIPE